MRYGTTKQAFTLGAAIVFAAAVLIFVQTYIGWRVRKRDPRFERAVLTGASFATTRMRGVRLGTANLTHLKWQGTQILEDCLHQNAVLAQPIVRQLLTSR